MKANKKYKLKKRDGPSFVKNNSAMSGIFGVALVGMAMAVILFFLIQYVGVFTAGTVSSELVGTFGTNNATGGEDYRTSSENITVNTIGNLSTNLNAKVDLMDTVATIAIVGIILMVVFRFGGV